MEVKSSLMPYNSGLLFQQCRKEQPGLLYSSLGSDIDFILVAAKNIGERER
jgi:hypothetical protein